ncbi:MAG: alpha/beta hydrolase [Actinomycetota bacterium]|nr:alpha/beta hydrolase [Actinomycetota bacterium]
MVVAHALGATLWLHHAARAILDPAARVDAVLLAAPLGAACQSPVAPAPWDSAGLRQASPWTQLVVGEDDAYLPVTEAVTMAATLQIDLDVIPAGGALDTKTGYGPWPCVRDWVHDRHTRLAPN